ncbi:MAG: phosphoribosylformylglycinamidine cyclo-ligase [Oligoflexus sp.]
MTQSSDRELYRQAGVDVAKGDELVSWLQGESNANQNPLGEVVSGIGGFSALFRPNFQGMEDPLLISGTDGVGTKVLLGLESDRLEGLGIDLVAMCVNDLYTIGGRPLFFLDYYATGVLDENQFKRILTGIRQGLAQSQALLLGGETAELPGLYEKGHFDLAGFVVGVVDGKRKLDPAGVLGDEQIFALPSSGFHSNGYSLIRRWLAEKPASESLLDHLMQPTRIYHEIPKILDAMDYKGLHAAAHITGGGISGNLPRVLPHGVEAKLQKERIPTPAWMQQFINEHNASFEQVEGVFNLGAGMICAVSNDAAQKFETLCRDFGVEASWLGELTCVDNKQAPSVKFY